ncbi:MAG: hypothetical protein HY550_07105, partial [Elusimicrobia bacterium]|nr:hypothetical protein [Elusimicrobiota bacterium]
MEKRFLELVSRAFNYPSPGFADRLLELEAYCRETPSRSGKAGAAVKAAEKFTTAELEEIYADLFYIKPLVSLELGYQLFGDERKRVEFLLHVKGLQQKYSVDCGTELPDSLPNVLTLLTRMEEGEDREELFGLALAAALAGMLAVMEKAKQEKDAKEKETKDHEKRRSLGIPVYLPLTELLAEYVKSCNCSGSGRPWHAPAHPEEETLASVSPRKRC